MIETSQCFDEYISSFITKFVPASGEEVQSFVEIKVVVATINER